MGDDSHRNPTVQLGLYPIQGLNDPKGLPRLAWSLVRRFTVQLAQSDLGFCTMGNISINGYCKIKILKASNFSTSYLKGHQQASKRQRCHLPPPIISPTNQVQDFVGEAANSNYLPLRSHDVLDQNSHKNANSNHLSPAEKDDDVMCATLVRVVDDLYKDGFVNETCDMVAEMID